ncbi:MAG TPA: M28 family peptidase [Luteitalea sp.]|nr:M28 family peptidase [Luteitalea sp.]
MRGYVLLACALLVASALQARGQQAASASAAPVGSAPFNDSIRKADLKADIDLMAGDRTRGRFIGTEQYAWTADFIASRFARLGLKPAGEAGTWFHEFDLVAVTAGRHNTLEVAGSDGTTWRPQHGQDFHVHRFGASGRVQAPVVFAGFGITAPALGYDDYRGDVKGRIVLILDHEPGERDANSPFDGVVTAEAAVPFRKVLAAQARGAVGVLFVSDVHNHRGPSSFAAAAAAYWPEVTPRIDRYFLRDFLEQVRIPAAQISPSLAATLLQGTGKTLDRLASASESAAGGTVVPLAGQSVTLTTDVVRHVIPDRSVLGLLEGSDTTLASEVVLISAHHDHNGADGNQIYNGADDNASGTAGVIDIAEAYTLAAQAGRRPRRSVLFAVFGSEERGPLIGSWAYTERPSRPLDKTIAVINMDMIGRHMEVPAGGGARFAGLPVQTAESNRNSVNVIGGSRAPTLKAAAERANQVFGLTLKTDLDNNGSNLLRRSDQWPFLQRGVPAIWFHTGLHPDYHTVFDRPEKIEYDKMERIVRLVHQLSWDLAQ